MKKYRDEAMGLSHVLAGGTLFSRISTQLGKGLELGDWATRAALVQKVDDIHEDSVESLTTELAQSQAVQITRISRILPSCTV